jgi:glyoxylate/hydroxypyruvate reductase A
MPAVLFRSLNDSPEAWKAALSKRIPDLDFRVWPDVGDPADIQYVLVWDLLPDMLDGMVNLRCVCSLGQGVDHLFRGIPVPDGVDIMRIVDPWMAQAMSEWVLLNVLRFHRQVPEYEAQQSKREWRSLPPPQTAERRVGILGLGALGKDAAVKISALGFDVAGWSRTEKEIDGVQCFHGAEGFKPFLNRTDILCCLLPLTTDTTDIINRDSLAALPDGAFVLNSGRGGHLVEADLIAALDAGHIAGAALDVFKTEPLPAEDPLWVHPKVSVWPHASAQTNAESGGNQIAEAIQRVFAGEKPNNLVDRDRQY